MLEENTTTVSDAAEAQVSDADAEATCPAPDAGDETPAPPEAIYTPQPELRDALTSTTEPVERKEVPGGRSYEIIYILRVGADGDQTAERVRQLVESNGGAIDNVRTSEPRRLAYPIKKQIEGAYVVVNTRFAKELTAELDRFFKLEEAILRHMVLREDV